MCQPGTGVVSHNLAYGQTGEVYPDCTVSDNILADPFFVDPEAGDYHLQAGSLAIDAGLPVDPALSPVDLDGNPRVADGDSDGTAETDMGAYEYVPTSPNDTTPPEITAQVEGTWATTNGIPAT
jgi:hypothetical protein